METKRLNDCQKGDKLYFYNDEVIRVGTVIDILTATESDRCIGSVIVVKMTNNGSIRTIFLSTGTEESNIRLPRSFHSVSCDEKEPALYIKGCIECNLDEAEKTVSELRAKKHMMDLLIDGDGKTY